MRSTRVIPVLLIDGEGCYKSIRFKEPRYIGDPQNAIRIFNDLGADELVILDIGASRNGRGVDPQWIADLAAEAFMPLAYGGGIRTLDDAAVVLQCGVEKIVLNSVLEQAASLMTECVRQYGSSTVVAGINVGRDWLGRDQVHWHGSASKSRQSIEGLAQHYEALGCGEIFLQSVERDGTMEGYDLGLIERVAGSVGVPVVACGGAGSLDDLKAAVNAGADAVAAGSFFVYRGQKRGILINYPNDADLSSVLP